MNFEPIQALSVASNSNAPVHAQKERIGARGKIPQGIGTSEALHFVKLPGIIKTGSCKLASIDWN